MLVQDDWHGPAPTHPSCVALLLIILFYLFPLVLRLIKLLFQNIYYFIFISVKMTSIFSFAFWFPFIIFNSLVSSP